MSGSIFDIPLDRSDCLIVMDTSCLASARNIVSQVVCQLTLLIGIRRRPAVVEIVNPYGHSMDVFIQCFNYIDDPFSGLLMLIGLSKKNIDLAIMQLG